MRLAATLAAIVSIAALSAADRPNIVYILADDLGYGDLGCYGQRDIATPSIDALARQGMRFTQHYAGNAVCTPSRSSLLTGRHPGRVRHRDNPRFVDSYGFLPSDVTFAELLRDAGYATGIAGKWHVGDRADTTDIPHHHGFDFAYCVGFPYPASKVEHWPSHLFINGELTPIPENTDGQHGRYMDDLYTDAALHFIRQKREQRFVIYLSFQGVHAPMDGALSPRYAKRDWPEVEKIFASMLERVDHNVGRVIDALDRLGLANNTLVIFTSDNGPHEEGGHNANFFRSSGGLRGGKRDLSEGGIRVPFIARWPGKIAPRTMSDHVSTFWDMLPTFAELAGVDTDIETEGISMVPALLGEPQREHPFLYWENQEREGQQAVRLGHWKAIRQNLSHDALAPWELYHLASDPAELHDLAREHLDVVAQIDAIAAAAHVPSPIAPLFRTR